MATSVPSVPPHVYFKSGFDVNENNIKAFRNLYRQLAKIEQFNDHEIDETSLLNAAQRLGIQADSDDHREFLQECLKYDDMQTTFLCVNIRIQGSVEPTPTNPPPTRTPVPTVVSDIDCVITIKRRDKEIDEFLHKYLLQVVKASTTSQ